MLRRSAVAEILLADFQDIMHDQVTLPRVELAGRFVDIPGLQLMTGIAYPWDEPYIPVSALGTSMAMDQVFVNTQVRALANVRAQVGSHSAHEALYCGLLTDQAIIRVAWWRHYLHRMGLYMPAHAADPRRVYARNLEAPQLYVERNELARLTAVWQADSRWRHHVEFSGLRVLVLMAYVMRVRGAYWRPAEEAVLEGLAIRLNVRHVTDCLPWQVLAWSVFEAVSVASLDFAWRYSVRLGLIPSEFVDRYNMPCSGMVGWYMLLGEPLDDLQRLAEQGNLSPGLVEQLFQVRDRVLADRWYGSSNAAAYGAPVLSLDARKHAQEVLELSWTALQAVDVPRLGEQLRTALRTLVEEDIRGVRRLAAALRLNEE